MDFRVGTSGFSYDEWKGSFYPEDLPKGEMLRYYAARMPAVEINNTFYRMPKSDMLEGWAADVPDDFTFVLKVSRRITHSKKLAECGDDVAYLWSQARVLASRLGPFLVQLPPYLKRDDGLLREFLATWPDEARVAVEFRSSSWFEDPVYQVLSDAGAALVVSDQDDKDPPPVVGGAPFGYARLRRTAYDDTDLDRWITAFGEQGWERCWVFFKHEEEGTGPALAARFRERVEAGGG